ncbi:uncharacterized protein [Zea mays]|uniref:AT-rich interactive domain-containing protein 2 n=1 Tax=Zea mays TaxID=4577 RepID=A0A1D6JSQ7_MAIZE|nr:uncharacterized protein LOC103632631 isoform X2 [Zea mays]XP_023156934.1 uncharacterized protein LOC103632631 isoform X2 [Zea mays]XP_035818942.1 uncharacterized protein LOC103632631 isoform X2 [Zea mays]ONL94938.1 AT-rich interactive domain-containing protein 2 [Zea mays]ONL94946.1 AT-rich interactive domain-containing protein 2 [Zea mays]ONL94951.1 AT-rich interactive domain-containing protein 2 [Zea mays]|eukprot:XP_023156933.1 uncharacterized protein LOC103632631 isoform X2 [Zea mays]
MLHQENSEAFGRHHSEQLACVNMRGADNGHPNFLPEKCQIAVHQRGEKVGLFDEELVHGIHLTSPCVQSPFLPSGVKETPIVDHNKRPASSDILDIVECKRLKQEDQIVTKEDNHTSAEEEFHDYPTYTTCERSFDSPLYESEESEDEGVDSPLHCSHARTYVEDGLWPASFHQSVGPFSLRKPVPIGSNHQAELPECRPFGGRTEEDESVKWIRNSVVPMPGTDASSLVLEPVHCKAGCDCLDEGSINCVKKHVMEARENLKDSVGADAFRELGFYDMGEEVASRWSEEEERLFQQVVSSNRASLRRNFWDELPLAFPSKSSKELVSYYFNVFMLRKRAEQNRFDPANIDSDDDEWQAGGDFEFPITGRTDEYMPIESLTDQDDVACNPFPLEGDLYGDSDDEDELDNSSGDRHNGVQRAGMLSEGHPEMSFIDHDQQTLKLDADAQDDSCTSFEAHQVGCDGGAHTDIGNHYRSDDGLCGGAEHGFFGDHCDTKEWGFGFSTGWERHDFLSTNNVIEEVFGKGSSEDGSDTATGQDLI